MRTTLASTTLLDTLSNYGKEKVTHDLTDKLMKQFNKKLRVLTGKLAKHIVDQYDIEMLFGPELTKGDSKMTIVLRDKKLFDRPKYGKTKKG